MMIYKKELMSSWGLSWTSLRENLLNDNVDAGQKNVISSSGEVHSIWFEYCVVKESQDVMITSLLRFCGQSSCVIMYVPWPPVSPCLPLMMMEGCAIFNEGNSASNPSWFLVQVLWQTQGPGRTLFQHMPPLPNHSTQALSPMFSPNI